ncbi:MAG: efflux RND transporter periplasmic adaptor subunit [Pseudomonadota bacterium]
MRRLLLTIATLCFSTGVLAEPLVFEGRVEAISRAELSSRLDGVVAEILFSGGESVEAGQPMIRLDPADAKLDLAAAEASRASAKAQLTLATQDAERTRSLHRRGIATPAQLQAAEAELARAAATMRMADVDLKRAQLMVERTVIRAPITGYAGRPLAVAGAFLEAESGAPLGEIVAIDPVVIAYRVPYATRLATMTEAGVETLDALFERLEIAVVLPGGAEYPIRGRPDHASALVDPADGTVTVRAQLANPDALLRPGMTITVRSRVLAAEALQ